MPGLPQDDGRNFLEWLKRHGQTERAIERFWKVVLVSALNEDLDRVSVNSAALVFRESFLKSPEAGRMGVPTVPLTELYGKAGDYISAHGGRVELRANVEAIQASVFRKYLTREQTSGRVTDPSPHEPFPHESPAQEPFSHQSPPHESFPHESSAHESRVVSEASGRGTRVLDPAVKLCVRDRNGSGEVLPEYAILAVPFDAVLRLVPDNAPARPLRELLDKFETSPITGVHLWFDRQITDLEHAVLLDRTIQWMFHKSRIQGRTPDRDNGGGSYVELVISASKSLVDKTRAEIIDMAVRELAEFFPAAGEARLLKATVIKEIHATFSPLPGSDRYRPASETPWPQVFLAGDWTATGWPATMEGAVRSGYRAAEAVCRAAGIEAKFVAPDLPATGLMKLFS
jgi:uncharacterized protein with NAD-binding domain and iron-sulfur cluster